MSHGSNLFARCLLVLLVLVSALPLLSGCSESELSSASASTSRGRVEATPTSDEFRDRIDRAIELTAQRHLVAESNAAWQVVHGILAFGPDLQLDVDGKPVSALGYLQQGGRLTGWNLIPG